MKRAYTKSKSQISKEKTHSEQIAHFKNCEYDPHLNKHAISLREQLDGNWIGEMQKNGKLIRCRQISPDIVLQYLLVHDGIVN